MVGLKEQASQGSFVPQRERDILSEAIGTKEPIGRTRGLGNLVSWEKHSVEIRMRGGGRRRGPRWRL